ncbi:RNA-guided endonuclease InsQ/TnpB family protein [Bacillus sp. FJAT-29937]|uniref:RNA-guided endonuclease InsQ/TnpB family protein n=1 Tax=Bacillus sp. FJAT-29937 TaxID=1720553 RepID=UPI000834102D|nr:RNA-guided endonuclease TnpB family protein [Bacillus sp. FJAT-29937]
MTKRTYKFKLVPTAEQQKKIIETLSLCRWLYNTCLEQRIYEYKTHKKSISFYAQKKELPILKKELPIFKTVHSQVLQDVLERLDKAYQAFFKRLSKGEKAGFPRFQGKNRFHSFTYSQSGFKLNGKFLSLSKIGDLRIKCHRQIQGKIKTCTIVHKNSRFYVCFACEMTEAVSELKTNQSVGVDLGVTHLAITSDGQFFDNPKHLQKAERRLKQLQRAVSKKKKGSNRRQKAVRLLAKWHEHIANKRRDTAHKVSRQLVSNYDLIVFEDLNIQDMVKNRHLSKSITDSAWRKLIQFTQYKAENAGKEVVCVNPYNTSQICSSCRHIVKKTLAERLHKCLCGYEIHRDVNAAKNILQLGLQQKQTT